MEGPDRPTPKLGEYPAILFFCYILALIVCILMYLSQRREYLSPFAVGGGGLILATYGAYFRTIIVSFR